MKTAEYFSFVVNEIHTTIVATVDDDGLPVTAAIDMMDYDKDGLYFLTAMGKSFYDRFPHEYPYARSDGRTNAAGTGQIFTGPCGGKGHCHAGRYSVYRQRFAPVYLVGRYYTPRCGRHRERGKFTNARLFCSDAHLH